jgi:hypothetical protein
MGNLAGALIVVFLIIIIFFVLLDRKKAPKPAEPQMKVVVAAQTNPIATSGPSASEADGASAAASDGGMPTVAIIKNGGESVPDMPVAVVPVPADAKPVVPEITPPAEPAPVVVVAANTKPPISTVEQLSNMIPEYTF